MTLEFSKEENSFSDFLIREKVIDDDFSFFIWAKKDRKDFYDKLAGDKKNKGYSIQLLKTLRKISQHGIPRSLIVGTLKQLDTDSALYEVRVLPGTFRVYAYVGSEPYQIVLIKDFIGHKGSDKIPQESIKSMKKQAQNIKEYILKGVNDESRN
jgi:hypothetical protein